MQLKSYLTQAFPKTENKWKTIISISLFIILFLLVFQPFGIAQIDNTYKKTLFISGFGFVCFTILFFYLIVLERLFPSFYNEKAWCIYKEFISLYIIISSIGLANVFYISLFSSQAISYWYIFNFQLITFSVALFPIAIFTVLKHNHLLRKHSLSANYVNNNRKNQNIDKQDINFVCIFSYNKKKKIEFKIKDLCFIESKGNNIDIYIYEEAHIAKKTLRNTLKETLNYLSLYPEIIKCHRAYLVNTNKIIDTRGNSQGLILKLNDCNIEIPVSRSSINRIKAVLT